MGCSMSSCFPVPVPPPRDGREETPDVVRGLYSALVDEVTSPDPSSPTPTPSTTPTTTPSTTPTIPSLATPRTTTPSSIPTSTSTSFTQSPTQTDSATPFTASPPQSPSTRASGDRKGFESKYLRQLNRPRSNEEAAGTDFTEEESEYLWVKSMFDSSGGDLYSVLKIERIQNPKLAKPYNAKRQMLETEDALDERWLFHGTTRSAAASIVENNFDLAKTGKHWNLYGKGIYFSPAASYSCFFSSFAQFSRSTNYAYYTRQIVREGVPLQVILARVLVGKQTRGFQGLKKLPEGYHSAVDDVTQPWIFVLFENCQILPCYVVTFVK